MDRVVAIAISALLALAVYALVREPVVEPATGTVVESGEEGAEGEGGSVVFPSVGRRASANGGGGGSRKDSMNLGRPPTCVTPRRGCGFVLHKDEPAPRQSPRKRGWLSFGD